MFHLSNSVMFSTDLTLFSEFFGDARLPASSSVTQFDYFTTGLDLKPFPTGEGVGVVVT